MHHVVELVLNVGQNSTFSVCLLDHCFWSVFGVFDFMVICCLAFAVTSASTSGTNNFPLDFGVLLGSCHWVYIGHLL